jgi:antitoxin HigA-1
MSIWSITIDREKGANMDMHNPAHPGEVIREACLKPSGLTVKAAAEGLGVTRKTLSDLVNGHSGVSPDMAIRLEKAGWSTADAWLKMQLTFDLWNARQRASKIKVRKFPAPEIA